MDARSTPAAPVVPVDDAVRQRIVHTFDRPWVVEAGAGTGKTTLLVARLVHALETGRVSIQGVVAISFTEKAAAELGLRLRQSLEHRAASAEISDAARVRLRRALQDLHRARISTIHAFASTILRERPAEARVDPQFRVLDELESLQMQRGFWRRWVDAELEQTLDDEALRSVLMAGVQLEPDLRTLALALDDNRDIEALLRTPPAPHEIEAAMRAAWDAVRACRDHAEAYCRQADDRGGLECRRLFRRLQALDELAPESWPAVFLGDLRINTTAGRREAWTPGAADENKMRRLRLQQQITTVRQALSDGVLRAALMWVRRFLEAYAAEKQRQGVLDFQDLLLRARALVSDDLAVRTELGQRIEMLCVDEFQDTDPLQAELVMLLAEEGRPATRWEDVQVGPKLFLVGDPKQSIYRFRRADLDVYAQCCAIVERCGGAVLDVRQNFRSRPGILHWVNGVFAELFGAGGGAAQPRAVDLVPSTGVGERPAVWIVTPGQQADASAGAAADSWRHQEAQAVVRLIARALDERWTVRHRDGTRDLEPGDVAILFARTAGIELYEDALRRVGLPFRQEGGRLFFQRQEIRDVLHALAAIDDPQDALALVAALRSPLFGISDEELWLHRRAHGAFSYLQPSDGSPLHEALALLAELHAVRNTLGVEESIAQLLTRTSAWAVYAARPHGERTATNFEMLLRQARGFASTRPVGLREFVHALRELDDETPRLSEWSPDEESSDRVRLLTVHMAKGLEFPFVVLANLGARGNPQPSPLVCDRRTGEAQVRLRLSDLRANLSTRGYDANAQLERERENAEERRLLYVAATRARDYLALGTFHGQRVEGLLKALTEVPGSLGEAPFGALGTPERGTTPGEAAAWCVLSADELPAATRRGARTGVPDDVEARLTARRSVQQAHATRPERWAARADEWRRDATTMETGCVATDTQRVEQVTRQLLQQLPESADATLVEVAAREAAQRALVEARAEEIAALVHDARTSEVAARARAARHAWRGLRLVRAGSRGLVEAQLDLVFEAEGGCVLVHYTTQSSEEPPVEHATALVQRAWVLAGAGRRVIEAGHFHLYESAYVPLTGLETRLRSFEA